MSDTVIKVENIGKKYRIGALQRRHDTLRDQISSLFKRSNVQTVKRSNAVDQEEFWALKDVSFEVKQGEIVGIIGRNGAGKSTLLKILSKITEPTEGRIELKGRVGSLLEVGTGFHPELTGRENIYLNGAILGMTKAEISRKFDEIVDFSEIEKFIDTPVKHYSSGMYVRLAFAVAAHLEPEILMVDEVLAVGDAQFQKKCLGKMGEVAKGGRTVLFVSHNMAAVEALCEKACLFDNGKILKFSNTKDIVSYYINLSVSKGEFIRKISDKINWLGVSKSNSKASLKMDDDLTITFSFYAKRDIENLLIDIAVHNEKDERIIHAKEKFVNQSRKIKGGTKFNVIYKINKPNLIQGKYFLVVYAYTQDEVLFWGEKIDGPYISGKPCFGITENFDGINGYVMPEYSVNYELNKKCNNE